MCDAFWYRWSQLRIKKADFAKNNEAKSQVFQ
jgi:hypothetical protein